MIQKLRSLLCALPALAGSTSAQIDSGGGKSAVGTMTNHASIGGIVATAPALLGSLTLRNGLIEILYATAPLDPDADANANGLAFARLEDHAQVTDCFKVELRASHFSSLISLCMSMCSACLVASFLSLAFPFLSAFSRLAASVLVPLYSSFQ
jgi:hypothetical protein